MTAFYDQREYDARFEWGPEGVQRLASAAAVIVIVDVLTFSTAVCAAVTRGATVYPYELRDASAEERARELGAALAVSRMAINAAQPYSLSPSSLTALAPGSRL